MTFQNFWHGCAVIFDKIVNAIKWIFGFGHTQNVSDANIIGENEQDSLVEDEEFLLKELNKSEYEHEYKPSEKSNLIPQLVCKTKNLFHTMCETKKPDRNVDVLFDSDNSFDNNLTNISTGSSIEQPVDLNASFSSIGTPDNSSFVTALNCESTAASSSKGKEPER